MPIYDNEESVSGIIYNGASYYFQKNLQGDVIELVDEEAEVVARYSYDAWGKVTGVRDKNGNAITGASHVANINPFRYRGYYFDGETGLYYLQSRYYDPQLGRWLNVDDSLLVGVSGSILKYSFIVYCENNPISRIDTSGCYWRDALSTHVKSYLKWTRFVIGFGLKILTEGTPQKVIKYEVPLYNQKSYSLCWAFCQVMVESYQKGEVLSNKEATERAIEIAQQRAGSNVKEDWNTGGKPLNLGERIYSVNYRDINALYNMLYDYGPLYASYHNDDKSPGHGVVITGVNVTRDIVYTNNPWGVRGKQSFEKFKKGFARKWYMSSSDLTLTDIYKFKFEE